MKRIDVKMLGGGRNWLDLSAKIALGLSGYYSPLPKGSTVSINTYDPGLACMQAPSLVAQGRFHTAISTPGWFVKLAREGRPPFRKKLPLKALATFAHDDRLVFAIKKELGIGSFKDLRDRKFPLKVSTVPPKNRHPALWGTQEVLKAHGLSLAKFETWGGKLLSDRPRHINAPGSVPATPGFDAVFDEAIMTRRWQKLTDENDLVFLPLEDAAAAKLAAAGWKIGALEKGRFRGVDADVRSVDFSDWVLFCHEKMNDELAYLIIRAIDEQKEEISGLFPSPFPPMTGPVDMERICMTPIPLHPGAMRYYQEKNYLPKRAAAA